MENFKMNSIEERMARIETKLDFLIQHMNDSKVSMKEVEALKNKMVGGWVATTVIASLSSLAIKFFVH